MRRSRNACVAGARCGKMAPTVLQGGDMRGPHDVGGLEDGPIDHSTHELAFWEKQIDAVRGVVGAKGIASGHENRRNIEQLGHDVYEKLNYYERWTAALQRQLIDKGVLTQDEIDAKVAQVRQRLAETGELELRAEEETKCL
jgi:hypothetical protein